MIVCRDNKWFGNVSPDEFTCNPTCDGDTLGRDENGDWVCTDKYDEESRQTIKDYHCEFACKEGYVPKHKAEATCDIKSGTYKTNCQPRCVKSCESKNMSPCATGKGCCPRPVGAPCDKQKKPKVAGGWWECMLDEHRKETCALKCLNGIIPTNKHGYHVSIKCDKARWWANDPCIADLCKVEDKPKNCFKSQLPNVEYGDWQCTNGDKESSVAGTVCTLDCDGGNIVHHAFECSPDGDWFKRYGSGKCICEPGCDSKKDCCKDDSGNKKDPNYNPLCMPCPHKCKQDACDKKDLPPIHGNGNWRCAWIKNDKGEKEYACVVMCGKNKTKQIMSCRANDNGVCKWRGNVNGVCKCEEQCDMSDLTYVHHGEWGPCSVADDFSNGIAHHSCELRCNGKVTSCKATCSQGGNSKGNWQYSSEIKKDFCSKLKETGKDPCKNNECIKCNDMTVPSIPNGQWDCKKKHCDLECDAGYKVRDGKCSLKCENHAWKVIGNPKCVPVGVPPEPPIHCDQFIQVPNGWMECKKDASATCMLMCNKDHRPQYCTKAKDTYADYDCKTGYFNPRGPKGKKSEWGCEKGKCDVGTFGQTCWDDPRNKGMKKPNF